MKQESPNKTCFVILKIFFAIYLRRQHPTDTPHIGGIYFCGQVQITFPFARFFGQIVTGSGLLAGNFTRTAFFKTLFGTTVCFHFRHEMLLSQQ